MSDLSRIGFKEVPTGSGKWELNSPVVYKPPSLLSLLFFLSG